MVLTLDGPDGVFLSPVVEPPCPEFHDHEGLAGLLDVLEILKHQEAVLLFLEIGRDKRCKV